MPSVKSKAAIVPPPEPPWLVEPEEQPVMRVPMAEVMVLEKRHMTEPEHKVAVAELQHQPRMPETRVAEVPEVPRLE